MGGKRLSRRRKRRSCRVIIGMLAGMLIGLPANSQTRPSIALPFRPQPVTGTTTADDILKRYPNGRIPTQSAQQIGAKPSASDRLIQPQRAGITNQDIVRLSWLGWWEAESEAYLETEDQKIVRPPMPKAVFDVLVLSSKSNDPLVRAEAVLALSRSRMLAAESTLLALATDKIDAVQFNAYLGLGLLNSAATAGFLAKVPAADSPDRAMWLAAVGLMPAPPAGVWQEVLKTLGNANAPREARRLALWALRTQKPDFTHQILQIVVDQVPELDLLNEALIGLGESSQAQDMELLIDIAGWNARVWEIPAIAAAGRPVSSASTALTGQERLAEQAQKKGVPVPPVWKYVRPGKRYTSISLPALRDTAQRVLTKHFVSSDRARDAIRRPFFMPKLRPPTIDRALKPENTVRMDIPWETFEIANRMISSGSAGDIDYLETAAARVSLESQYDTNDPRLLANDVMRNFDSSIREHAAISLGLSLRKAHPGMADAPGEISPVTGKEVPSATALLIERVAMQAERSDLRAACALAIGLSKNTSHAARLKGLIDNPEQAATDVAKGFAILALGLLGDAETLKYAAIYLPPVDDETTAATLVRMYRSRAGKSLPFPNLAVARAVVEALEAAKDPAAVPMLINHWGYDRNLNLSIAKALSGLKRSKGGKFEPLLISFTSAMIELASPADKSKPDLSAITSLGILYDDGASAQFAKLIAGGSIVSPEVKKVAFRASYSAALPSLPPRRN